MLSLLAILVSPTTAFANLSSSLVSKQISAKQAMADLDEFEQKLAQRWSYLNLNSTNLHSEVKQLRLKVVKTPKVSVDEFAIDLMKLIVKFGDAHAKIEDWPLHIHGMHLPFLIDFSDKKFVAYKTSREGFLAPSHPFIQKIDGISIAEWLKASRTLAPNSSQQINLNQAIRNLRYIQFLRKELGLPPKENVDVELIDRSGNTITLTLPLQKSKPIYGSWPQNQSAIKTVGNKKIGYLRISKMNSRQLEQIKKTFAEVTKDTDGLIIDVRGNSGGKRNILNYILPKLMPPSSPPVVVNAATYRIGSKTKPGDLADRFLFSKNSGHWSQSERNAIDQFVNSFQPKWNFDRSLFSPFHYMAISPDKNQFYEKKIIVLQDRNCFSATDIFLAGMNQLKNVTTVGEISSGGSGRLQGFTLDHSQLYVLHSTIASFQPNGLLFDGHGVSPDIPFTTEATYFIGKTDQMLDFALRQF